MILTKQTNIDQITINENGIILIREAVKILEDDIEISKQYHRSSLEPGVNVSNQPQNIQDICKTIWTADVIAAYQASLVEGNAV